MSRPDTLPVTEPDPTGPLAEWLATQPAGTRPEPIAEAAREAAVVGLGVSTREAHETFEAVAETTWHLLARGFTTLALLDTPRVADLYDRYVTGQDVDVDRALAQAWGPWQVAEMRDVLARLRERNRRSRSGAPVRIIGVAADRAVPADYDRILDLLAGLDARTAAQVGGLLEVIRPAHESGEHVLRARGTHPGTPFVELARAARAAAATLRPTAERDVAVQLLDGVVDFHSHAIGVGQDLAREERDAADRLLGHHRRSGDRIVLWEGSTRIAAHPGPMLGAHLRTALGDRYLAVHVVFGHGHIARAAIPPPRADSLEAQLVGAGSGATLDLRAPVPQTGTGHLDRSWPTRIVSGVYDPDRDAEHYLDLPSLPGSFDVLVYLPTITPIGTLTAIDR